MATLTNTKIKDTYDGLLKTTDNDVIGASEKVITDGLGNASVLSIGTASASFSSDIEINTLTIGKGANDVSTNTALGYQTLENATGGGNTAVGYASLLDDTTGVQNTAVGVSALGDNTTGSYNTALGSITLDVNTEGNHNVAVGYRSLAFNTTGQKNVAVGSQALSTQTIGSFSTAVGYEALMSQTTGSNNTAIGYASMRTSTTGTYNVAIGVASLYDNTEGSSNVAVGRYALTNSISGDGNIGIGNNSGNQLTTGSNNIYIGNTAEGSAADNDNEIVIGYNATGNGSNTATYGNSSITEHHFTAGQVNVSGNLAVDTNTLYVDAANNRVGVGTSSPAAGSLLDVNGDIKLAAGAKIKFNDDRYFSPENNVDGAEISANGIFKVKTGATPEERFRIDSSGNVGIGTSNPNFSAAGRTVLDINGSINTMLCLSVGGTAGSYVYHASNNLNISNEVSGDIISYTGGSERMRIDSDGNVGIGTQSPSKQLELDSANPEIQLNGTYGALDIGHYTNGAFIGTTSGSGMVLRFGTEGTERMRIDSSGNTVIRSGNQFRINRTDNATFASFDYSAGTGLAINDQNSDGIRFLRAGSSESMRIDSSGNVGIGTSSPASFTGFTVLSIGSGTNGGILNIQKAGTSYANISADNNNLTLDAVVNTQSIVFRTGVGTAERMRIDSSGRVGIGTSNIYGDLHLQGGEKNVIFTSTAADGVAGATIARLISQARGYNNNGSEMASIDFVTNSSAWFKGDIVFKTNNTDGTDPAVNAAERMRITSGGEVYVGLTNGNLGTDNGWILNPSGGGGTTANFSGTNEIFTFNQRDGAGTTKIDFRNGNVGRGNITWTTSGTAFNTSSDYRLKENVVEMTGALDRVDALKPSRFNFIADPEKTVDGFLAHEVQDIVPEAVTGEKDAVDEEGNPIYQGIDQSKIVPLLVGAIQELRAEIESLKSQLNA